MPTLKLTDAFVRNAIAKDGGLTEYADEKEKGLALRVSPAGAKSWTFRYRLVSGKQKRISLGKFPDVPLSEARGRVVQKRAEVAAGGDPAAEAKNARATARQALEKETFQEVGQWYFRECQAGRHRPNLKRPKRQSTIQLERYYFDRHIVPEFGDSRLDELKRATVQAFVDRLGDDFSLSTARQCRIILHAIYVFAQRREITDVKNPCEFVTVAATGPRDRVLSDTEIHAIWTALKPPIDIDGAAISASVGYACLLATVTLQRRGEVTGMRLDEIDRDQRLWTIPGKRTKNHRTQVVPLSDLALDLIDAALSVRNSESAYVFPSPRDPSKPIQPAAMTRAFGRLKKALNLGDIRPHDLRRTGATNLTSERLGFSRFTVSKVLNHASDTGGAAAVTGVYDKNEYLAEKRRALDAWSVRLKAIVNGAEAGNNVIAFSA